MPREGAIRSYSGGQRRAALLYATVLAATTIASFYVAPVAYAQVPLPTQGCGPVVLVSPTRQGPTVTTERPTPRWQSLVEAKRYRVRVRSQIPNGGILHDIDAVTSDNQFTPATALAEQLANIRVQIIADCEREFTVTEPPDFRGAMEFWLDPALTCEAPRWLMDEEARDKSSLPGEHMLHWQQSASAQRYELTLFSGAEASVQLRQALTGTRYPLSTAFAKTPLVASLRARCENGWSEPAQIVIHPMLSR